MSKRDYILTPNVEQNIRQDNIPFERLSNDNLMKMEVEYDKPLEIDTITNALDEDPDIETNLLDKSSDSNDSIDTKLNNGYIFRIKRKTVTFCNRFICKEEVFYEYLNKLNVIFLHIMLLSLFETYFFFKYVSVKEKDAFTDKLDYYVAHSRKYTKEALDPTQQSALNDFVDQYLTANPDFIQNLYDDYQSAIDDVDKQEDDLIAYSTRLTLYIGFVFGITLVLGIFFHDKMKWHWLFFENIMMIFFLACYEYYFFKYVIIKYDPISSAEINYIVVCDMLNGFHTTCNDYIDNDYINNDYIDDAG